MTLIPVFVAVAAFSQGQDATLADLLAGRSVPLEIPAKQLPAGFSAVEMQSTGGGGGGFESFLSSPFMMMGALMGGDTEQEVPSPEALAALTAVWTNGSTLRLDGVNYYVTYGYALTSAMGAPAPPSVLKLKLVRVDAVTSIRPLGNLSPDLSALAREAVPIAEPTTDFTTTAPLKGEEMGNSPAFLDDQQAISSEGRAARMGAMKTLMLRTEVVLGSNKNVFPYVQSSASMYGVLGNARDTATSPMQFYQQASCPRAGVRFVFNMSLAGVDATTVGNNASIPVWYEQDPDLDGNRVIGLLNGSARLVNTAEWSAHYASLIRKSYAKAKGSRPLPASHLVTDLPDWLKR